MRRASGPVLMLRAVTYHLFWLHVLIFADTNCYGYVPIFAETSCYGYVPIFAETSCYGYTPIFAETCCYGYVPIFAETNCYGYVPIFAETSRSEGDNVSGLHLFLFPLDKCLSHYRPQL